MVTLYPMSVQKRTTRKASSMIFISVALLCFVCLGAPLTWAGCGAAPDPRYDPSGYARWCRCMGGTVYNDARGYGCDVSGSGYSGGYSGYSGGDPSLYLMEQFFQGLGSALGKQLESLLNPDKHQGMEMDLQSRVEENRRRQEAERKKQEFGKGKTRMLSQMRATQTGTLRPRDVTTLPELNVREVDDVFGIKTLRPHDLSEPSRTASLSSGTVSHLKRAHCGAYLLRKANEAASKGKFEEAAYLSNEAAELMSGAKDSPSVVCPPLPEVPAFEAGPVAESQAMYERIKKQTIFFGTLYSRATQQMGDYRTVLKSIKQTEHNVQEARKRREEAQRKKEELQARRQQHPESVPPSVMAEALAALQNAFQAL